LLLRIPGNWIGNISSSADVAVKVLRCAPKNGKSGQCLIRIEGPGVLSEESIIHHVRSTDPEGEVSFSTDSSGRVLATVDIHSHHTCRVLGDSDCLMDSAVSRPDGDIQWTVFAPNGAALTRLVDGMKGIGASVLVENVTVLRTARELTAEQERVLQAAFDLGYYDIPKRIKLDELAKKLRISKAKLDVVLRRAQRKIIASHIGDV
jgi:predicted DNA binding protein